MEQDRKFDAGRGNPSEKCANNPNEILVVSTTDLKRKWFNILSSNANSGLSI